MKLDADGKANVSFDIPQFNGTARVMAVAWSKDGVGHGIKDIVIRDPVVVTASLPKFLAPGDKAELRLDIANTDAPAGDFKLQLTGNEAVGIEEAAASRTIHLDAGAKSDFTLSVIGKQPGNGAVSINLSHASGLSLAQTVDVPVRPSSLPVTERRVIALKPGAKLRVDKELLANSVLPGASVSVNVTRSAAFDIPALLMSLDRYPFGCAEQTTSRALPLLYLSELSKQNGLEDDADVKKRVQDAIYRVLSYQASAGSFGLWGPDSGDLWLDSYVTDFLTRAREEKYDVPDRALVQALENLQNALSYDVEVKTQGDQMPMQSMFCPQQEGLDQRSALLRRYDDQRLPDAACQGAYRRGIGTLRRCDAFEEHLRRRFADDRKFHRSPRQSFAHRLRLDPARRCGHPGTCGRKPPCPASHSGTGKGRRQGVGPQQVDEHPGAGLDAACRARDPERR
ncbi:hypothetical protein AJ87_43610 [Rhizobium yanglingense]|nr:hypothetical protein AJ87_43610 [Rhizobium yanglingense]